MARTCGDFCILGQNLLCATTACTFSTFNFQKCSGPKHFDLKMCFASQQCPLFPHLNFQVVRDRRVLPLFTSKCASRHNGVQFFIFHLASWLRTRRFSEPILFDPPEPQNTGITQCFAASLPFRAPASSLCWLSPSDLLHLSSSPF